MKQAGVPLLSLRNISKNFEGFNLEDISLDLFAGKGHVVVGENGCGKSTLMKLIAGWFPQDSGRIIINGRAVKFRNIQDAKKQGIIYMHQEIQCFDNLLVAENLFFGELSKISKFPGLFNIDEIIFKCREIFDELHISIPPDIKFGKLGFAERQMISAVKSYISDARLIIFDEPSSAMSQPEREILFGIISRLKSRGVGIFYISHRLDEINQVGDYVSVMQKGRLIGTEPCETARENRLIEMMIGDVHRNRYPKLHGRRGGIVLSVSDLTFEPTLKGVDFDLRQGEILGITGLMGSGRTLLANCLFGVVQPTSGEITVGGETVNFSHPGSAMSSGISLVPEDRLENGIFTKHDLQRNMTSATLNRFVNRFFLNEIFMNELTQQYVEILKIRPGKQNDLIARYSGGNQQKVMLAKWLMNRSPIYIMDEPTRGVDSASKIDIYNTMNDLASKGAAIILISSEIEETLGMADRILVLAGGKIAREFRWEEASKENIIAAAAMED